MATTGSESTAYEVEDGREVTSVVCCLIGSKSGMKFDRWTLSTAAPQTNPFRD